MKTQTTERTFNNKVKKQVIELMPSASKFVKKHVPGCGYVFYIKNVKNETIGNVSKTRMLGMLISIKG